MKKIKNETGSITTMVTVTIIFFITILSSAYMLMAVQRKAQLKSQLSTDTISDLNLVKTVMEDVLNNKKYNKWDTKYLCLFCVLEQ